MATFKSTGLDDIEKQIAQLKLNADDIETILRAGGLEVVEEIKKNVEALPTRGSDEWGTEDKKVSGISAIEKAGILHDLGTAKMQYKNGVYDVKVGFYKGYINKKTKKYPNGTPTQLVLRSLEKGTSWLKKQPVVRPAVKRSEKKAVEEMQKALNKIIEK